MIHNGIDAVEQQQTSTESHRERHPANNTGKNCLAGVKFPTTAFGSTVFYEPVVFSANED